MKNCWKGDPADPAARCDACQYGFDVSSDRRRCIKCPTDCEVCTDTGICTKVSHLTLFESGGFTASSTKPTNAHNLSVLSIQCYRGYGFDPKNKNKCIKCAKNCKRCHDEASALQCSRCRDQPGIGLDAKTRTCKRCTVSNCRNCDK